MSHPPRGDRGRYYSDEAPRSVTSGAFFREVFNDPQRGRGRGRRRGRGRGRDYGGWRDDSRGGGRDFWRGNGRGRGRGRDWIDFDKPRLDRAGPSADHAAFGGKRETSPEGHRDNGYRSGLFPAPPGPNFVYGGVERSEPAPRGRSEGRYTQRFGYMRDRCPPPSAEEDVNLTSRRKRKYVPGGRIPKYKKKQEYEAGTLYCDSCEKHFRDENAKALHDRSIDHQKTLAYNRKEEERQRAQMDERTTGAADAPSTPSFDKKAKNFTPEEIQKFFKDNSTGFTVKFKEWAQRSLQKAQEASIKEKNPVILQSVQKEVIAEYMFHTDECTMHMESWGRKAEATGTNYRGRAIASYETPVITDEQRERIQAQVVAERRALGVVDEERPAADSGSVPDNQVVDVDAPAGRWVRGETQGPRTLAVIDVDADATSKLHKADANHEASTQNGVVSVTGSMDVVEDDRVTADAEEEESRILPMNWKVRHTCAAMRLYYACLGEERELIVQKSRKRFPRSAEASATGDAGEETASLDSLMERYHVLRRQYENAEYSYDDWKEGVCSVIEGFKRRGTRIASLQSCLQMQVRAAIDMENWGDCFRACNELVRMYKHDTERSWRGVGSQYIGHWLMSLLFKTAKTHDGAEKRRKLAARRSVPGLFDISMRMRDLPARCLEDVGVHESLQVFTAVVTNNYWKFFDLYKHGLVHMKTDQRSKYLMEEFTDVVRERALLTMTMKSGVQDDPAFGYKGVLPIGYVVTNLGWEQPADEDDADPGLTLARQFIDNLRQGIEIGGNVSHGRSAMLIGHDKEVEVQSSEVVDVETLVKISGRGWRTRMG